jgi:ketosteroid isomerase-like protein
MTASKYIETFRAFYEALSRQDWSAAVRSFDQDFVLITPGQGLDRGTNRGPEEVARSFEDFFEPYEEVEVEPERFFERGDRIVVFFLQRARPRGSSGVVEVRAAHLWTVRDGRACRLEIFPERRRALQAAGLQHRGDSPKR